MDRELNQLLREAGEQLGDEEFEHVRRVAGPILGIADVEVMRSGHEYPPKLKPEGIP